MTPMTFDNAHMNRITWNGVKLVGVREEMVKLVRGRREAWGVRES